MFPRFVSPFSDVGKHGETKCARRSTDRALGSWDDLLNKERSGAVVTLAAKPLGTVGCRTDADASVTVTVMGTDRERSSFWTL